MKALPCPAELWPRFSALLDAALEVDEARRGAWLESLGPEQADLVPRLRAVLSASTRTFDPAGAAPGPAPVDAFAVGQRVGPWRLLQPLGTGGMGAVWRAERADGAYVRVVALKLPHRREAQAALDARFARETNALAGLEHPQIARFYDAGVTAEGQPWLALEYVDGQPITDHCEAHGLGVSERIARVRQVAQAVQAAHARLLVHRDLKPANVLVTDAGQVKLLDFGIAQLLGDAGDGPASVERAATPAYASPEQIGGGSITVATDVFALGVMLYELLCGARPWADRSRLGRLLGPAGAAPLASAVAPPERRAALRGDLDAILVRALAMDPADRYPSVEAFAADLGRHLDHFPVQARTTGAWQRARKFARRHRQAVLFSSLLAAVVVAGVGGVLWQAQRAAGEARRALAIRDFLFEVVFRPSDTSIAGDRPRAEISARALLDAGVARIPTHFADDPLTQAELLDQAGRVYIYQDENERARAVLEQRRAILEDRKGPLDAEVIEDELVMFWVAMQRGDRDAMAQHLARSDRQLRLAGLDRHLLRAEWWLAKGDLVELEGQTAAVRQRALEQARALYEQVAPTDSGHVATLSNLGLMRLDAGQPVEGLALFDQAIALHPQTPQKLAPDLARLHARRARALLLLGRTDDARAAMAQSQEMFRNSVGLDSPLANEARTTAGLLGAEAR